MGKMTRSEAKPVARFLNNRDWVVSMIDWVFRGSFHPRRGEGLMEAVSYPRAAWLNVTVPQE
jgi:hypothetical protein